MLLNQLKEITGIQDSAFLDAALKVDACCHCHWKENSGFVPKGGFGRSGNVTHRLEVCGRGNMHFGGSHVFIRT